MVNSDARCVKGRSVGKAGVELRGSCVGHKDFGPVRKRICTQEWLHGRDCSLSCREVGNCTQHCLGKPEPKTLVGKEKERSVPKDRTAKRTAEIILPLFSLAQRRVIDVPIEPVIGIESVISKVVECCAMELIRARARNDRDLSARCPSKLWRIGGSLDPKLMQGVYRNQAIRSALR